MPKGNREDRICLSEESARGKCRFCENRRLSVPLKVLAAQIDEVYRENFQQGFWSSIHQQEGNLPVDNIQEIAEIEFEVAEAIVDILSAEEYRAVMDGAEAYYLDGSHHVERDVYPSEQQWAWNAFYQRIRHQRRYFDDEGRQLLHDLLGNLAELEPSPVLTLRPNGEVSRIFRARKASSRKEAEKLYSDASREIGPPPPSKALAGRMSAHGIPVFYGTFSENLAVAEVRPYVGGLIVVGQFEIIRELKLLDLAHFVSF